MNALETVASSIARPFARRSRPAASGMGLNDMLANLFSSGQLPLFLQTTLQQDREFIESNYQGYVGGLYMRNPIVFEVLALRARLFAEMRFVFQQLRNGQPGQLFGTPELGILENPEPSKSTAEMLTAMILDADIAGDAFNLRRTTRIRRLRPDWTIIAYGAKEDRGLGGWDPDAEVVGYGHYPGGLGFGDDLETFLPEEVAHFTTNRDPIARNRGMSLLTPLIREVMADSAATSHKLQFFENGATANLLVTFPDTMAKESAQEWIELFEQEHRGALNAYKALYLGGGPTATAIGSSMEQMTFVELQSKAEQRIASLAGVEALVKPPDAGLGGGSKGGGNFGAAARKVGDTTLRPLWRDAASAFAQIINVPPGSRLWYSEKDIAFLREDLLDMADAIQKNFATIGAAIRDGFEPDSAVDAVTTGDPRRLVHTGLVSVQLQLPGTALPPGGAPTQPPAAATLMTVPTARIPLLTPQATAYRVRADFWPLEQPFAELGTIVRGTQVPAAHPVARAFPSMLEPDVPSAGQVVSRARVLEVQRQLLGEGRDAGYDSIARELNVHRETVRRRLKETE